MNGNIPQSHNWVNSSTQGSEQKVTTKGETFTRVNGDGSFFDSKRL